MKIALFVSPEFCSLNGEATCAGTFCVQRIPNQWQIIRQSFFKLALAERGGNQIDCDLGSADSFLQGDPCVRSSTLRDDLPRSAPQPGSGRMEF